MAMAAVMNKPSFCLRVLLDTALFLISYLYFRKLGLSAIHSLIGMSLLAWGMSYSHYDSDLQFNIFFDVLFYLLAGLCILHEKAVWIIPISLFAALNRETGGLIPFLFLFSAITNDTITKNKFRLRSSTIGIFSLAFILYVTIFVGVRIIFDKQTLIIPYGHHPGFELLFYNIGRIVTWDMLFATLGIIPILAVIGYQKWPDQLKVFFWVIVPIWFIVHIFGAVMAETRLFLVPKVMVFIPGT